MAPVVSKEAPAQYKQPSRKGKKAWRKHVDISDVQAGLQEARDDEIRGGRVADKPSNALFTLDTAGSTAIQESVKRLYKPLKSDQILAQRSAVPGLSTHKLPAGVTDGVVERSTKRRKTGGVSLKEYERLRQVAYGRQKLEDVIKSDANAASDLWAQNEESSEDDSPYTFLEKKKPTKAPATLRQKPKPLIANASEVEAIHKPKAGTSYNPAFEDWEALFKAEGDAEIKAEQRRLMKAQSEQELLQRIAKAEEEAEREAAWQTEDESAWEGFESDYDKPEWLSKKRPERKTPQERKKAERKKERERQEKIEKRAKEREKREKRIAELKAEVLKEAKLREQRDKVAVRAEVEAIGTTEGELRRRAPKKDKVPEKGLELVLPDELEESLRRLKPEGNLLKDRYRSMLLSGKMEARKPISQHKKKRVKATEKWSHKDFAVPVST